MLGFEYNNLLLKIMMNKNHYLQYREFIKINVLTKEYVKLISSFGVYYETFTEREEVKRDEYLAWFFTKYQDDIDDVHQEIYRQIITYCCDAIPTDDVHKIVVEFHSQWTQKEIEKVRASQNGYVKIRKLIESHERLEEEFSTQVDYDSFQSMDFLEGLDRSGGLKWRLNCLNLATTGLLKGDLIIVGASTNVGKTTFMVSEIANFATQCTQDILWFNNEEGNNKTMLKLMQAVLGVTGQYCMENREEVHQRYIEAMGGNPNRVKFIDISGKSLGFIQRMCAKYKPGIIILDQADKIQTEGAINDVGRIRELYGEIRGLAKQYGVVICASQAASLTKSAETGRTNYVHYRPYGDLDSSKVGKPGEADLIIMIAEDPTIDKNVRYINIAKNKMGELHNQDVVLFRKDICRYVDKQMGHLND